MFFFVRDMSFAGGKERVVATVANLLAHEINVGIVNTSLSGRNESFYKLDPRVSQFFVSGLNFMDKPRSLKLFYFIADLSRCVKFIREISRKGNGSIIGTDFLLSIILWMSTFLAGSKNIRVLAWEHLAYNDPVMSSRPILYKLRDFFYRKLYKVVVLTKKDEAICKSKKIPVICIPNPVPFVVTGFPDYEAKQVLTVARLSHQKGLDYYCEIVSRLAAKFDDWRFVFVAKPDDLSLGDFHQLLKEYDLFNRVNIEPPTKEIQSHYLQSSIYLMTSRYEGLPMTLLEAQECGLPCISFACENGPAEIIRNDVNGILVQPFDVEAMVEGLEQLMDSRILRE